MSDYIQLAPDELLERIARTLKKDIGPAVEAAYPKTQTFMASVVLQKLAGQLRLAAEHAAASQRDLKEVAEELDQLTASGDPQAACQRPFLRRFRRSATTAIRRAYHG